MMINMFTATNATRLRIMRLDREARSRRGDFGGVISSLLFCEEDCGVVVGGGGGTRLIANKDHQMRRRVDEIPAVLAASWHLLAWPCW